MASRPSKRQRVTPPREDAPDSANPDTKVQKAFFKSASNWNLEHAYESKTRKGKKKDAKKNANDAAGRLPVKTAGGEWQVQDDAASVASDADWLENEGDDGEIEEEPEAAAPPAPKIPEREQIRNAQEELAKIAAHLNEDPEEHSGAFKAMARIGESRIPSIQKLCMVTQMTVYKDVIPGYRIRPATEEAEKLSKDVKRLRTYEQALVSGYQNYIKSLAYHAASRPTEGGRKGGKSLSSIAFTCTCTLVNAVPHFNFRGDLLRILVRKLSTRHVNEDFIKCQQALETLFQEDEEGNASQEAVSLLSKMMRTREYRVDESVLNMFLRLRLLAEFYGKASQDRVDRPDDGNGKKPKGKKEFRTKRERKLMKQQKEADKVMAHADAAVSHEEREKMQSETLKMVFATYFRILKERVPHLMGAVLEGLAKYSHLINQDFFGDLLEALKDLIRDSHNAENEDESEENGNDEDDELSVIRDTSREALLCTVTAFALLEGQDAHNARSDLHLDLSFFITNLYRSLLSLSVNADLELGAKSLHLTDPSDPSFSSSDSPGNRRNNKVNLQTTTVLLLRCLSSVLLPPWNIRSVPPLRLAAFTKQLMGVALQMPEKSCQAILGLLHDVVHTHGRKVNALWNTEERKGDGTHKPLSETVEGSNPFTTTVWEGEILRKHYCPKVREELKAMEKEIKGI